MGVSPVSMQVMIPKTVEVARQQSSEMHKINADQQNIVQKETQRQENDTKKVHDRNSAEKIYVDEEKGKEEKEKGNKKSNNEEDEVKSEVEADEKEDTSDYSIGRHFDASV